MLEEGLIQKRWHPAAICVGGGLNTGTMAAVPPALAGKPHNPLSPFMSLVPQSAMHLTNLRVSACS